MDKSLILEYISNLLLENKIEEARTTIQNKYPHKHIELKKRSYTLKEKMEQFIKDGFIDRYTGKKLLNPGILKVLSVYFPDEFPFHSHWKMTETHIAYWELVPTIDHIYPIARGGKEDNSNWVTTSMKNNSLKNNYTVEEIHWDLYPQGDMKDWDGLSKIFIKLVDKNTDLLKDDYIKSWYNITKKLIIDGTSNSSYSFT